MKLRSKLILITLGFTLLTTFIIGSILNTVVQNTYRTVEMDVFEQRMVGFNHQIIMEFSRIETILLDWSVWDLTYNYVINQDEHYLEDNISKSLYEDQNINYLAIFSDDNQFLYGEKYLKEENRLVDLTPEVISLFSQYKYSTGLLNLGDEMVIYVSLPVTDNDGIQPKKGHMIFAYTVGLDMKERLEDDNGFVSTIEIVDDLSLYSNTVDLEYGLKSSIEYIDDEGIGNIFFPMINGDQYLLLSINLGNEIHTLGREYIKDSILYTLMVLCIFSILVFISLGHFVIKRIVILNKQVNEITHHESDKKRVTELGKDELGQLSININDMLNNLEKMHSEIEHYASFDAMTGTFNRRIGFEILEDLMKNYDRSSVFSIAYLDINDLKEINDIHGHFNGDQLILDTVSILYDHMAIDDSIIRLGGDEFLLVLPNHNNIKAETLMKQVDHSITEFNKSKGRVYTVSISYGIAEYDGETSADLFIDKADNRMYHAKKLYRELKRESN
jgi:diguanylate cyclase (GGDEF)-like protein